MSIGFDTQGHRQIVDVTKASCRGPNSSAYMCATVKVFIPAQASLSYVVCLSDTVEGAVDQPIAAHRKLL